MSRGVDLDAIAIKPALEPDAVWALVDRALLQAGYEKLSSIEDIKLDLLAEWLQDGERCVALTETRGGWQYLYDTTFSTAEIAEPLSQGLPGSYVLQLNLQEETDFTLRILKGGKPVLEFSRGAEFSWPPDHDLSRVQTWEKADPAKLSELLDGDKKKLAAAIAAIAKGEKGERVGKGPRVRHVGGVQDAVQDLAAALGMPHVYRFFEGWMKSDLDWDEDEVVGVHAFRKKRG